MKTNLLNVTLCCLALGLLAIAGCGDGKSGSAKSESGHDHGDEEKLRWEPEKDHEGFKISVGRHGEHVHAGEDLEPAALITKDGKPVADAELYSSLLSEDKETVLAKELKGTYEPEGDGEPAHYGYLDLPLLAVPKDVTKAIIRYRIVLPGDAGEFTQDVEVEVHAEED